MNDYDTLVRFLTTYKFKLEFSTVAPDPGKKSSGFFEIKVNHPVFKIPVYTFMFSFKTKTLFGYRKEGASHPSPIILEDIIDSIQGNKEYASYARKTFLRVKTPLF